LEFDRIAVFCGSRTGTDREHVALCEELALEMTDRGIDLVYGGGNVGLMGILADQVLMHGGKVYGVIPEKLMAVERGHTASTELYVVKTMHERKAKMAEMADAFIAIPGGIGTMEEIFEVFTWAYLGYHEKPCGILNYKGFYDPLIELLDKMGNEGYLSQDCRDMLCVAESAESMIEMISKPVAAALDERLLPGT